MSSIQAPGDIVPSPPEAVTRIQNLLCTLFELPDIKASPAALAKSLDRVDIDIIQRGYVCSQKADGVRVLLLLTGETAYLFLRNWDCQMVPFASDGLYLFDTELVAGTHAFVFDCLIYKNQPAIHHDYLYRIELFRRWLSLHGTEKATAAHPLEVGTQYAHATVQLASSLQVLPKPVFNATAQQVWTIPAPFLVDGLIFTRLLDRYRMNLSSPRSILKWKPLHEITIDFHAVELARPYMAKLPHLLQQFQTQQGQVSLQILDKGRPVTVAKIDTALRGIIECGWSHGQWRVVRDRPDKARPNSHTTVVATLYNIIDDITIEEL